MEKGQAFVEFAFVLLIFLFLVVTTFDLAPVVPIIVGVKAAANHGTREAMIWDSDSGITCEQAVENAVASRTTDIPAPTVTVTGCSGMTPLYRGQLVIVTVTSVYQPPFWGTLFDPVTPRTLTITRDSELRKW